MRRLVFTSFTLLLLCLISRINRTNAQGNSCSDFGENFTCPGSILGSTLKYAKEFDCEADLVGTTLNLLEEGDKLINYTQNGEATMLIGRTGVGKSTLGYFIAGDDTQMYSVFLSTGRYNIRDCNNKIGTSTIVSATVFPDLIVDSDNNAFYDNPEFQDTRTTCVVIANTYFMKKVADNLRRVKFVMVINFSSLTIGEDRAQFTDMLRSVFSFVSGIEKFGAGLAIVGTKLRIYDSDGETEEMHAVDAKEFMSSVQTQLGAVFAGEELRKANYIIDSIKHESKIGVFRMPKSCGLISDLEEMQTNKQKIRNMIQGNLNYVEATPTDFNFTISATAQLSVIQLSNDLNTKTISMLERFSLSLKEFVISDKYLENCEDVMASFQKIFSNPAFAVDYDNDNEWLSLNFTQVLRRISNETYLPNGYMMPVEVSEAFDKYGRYLDFLHSLKELNVNVIHWLSPLREFRRDITNEVIEIGTGYGSQAKDLLEQFCSLLKQFVLSYTCPENCKDHIDSLEMLFKNPDFLVGYDNYDEWLSLSFSEVILRILNEAYLPVGFTIPVEISDELNNYGKCLDLLQSTTESNVNVTYWLSPLKEFHRDIVNEVKKSEENLLTDSSTLTNIVEVEL